jgi:hypothetical protein
MSYVNNPMQHSCPYRTLGVHGDGSRQVERQAAAARRSLPRATPAGTPAPPGVAPADGTHRPIYPSTPLRSGKFEKLEIALPILRFRACVEDEGWLRLAREHRTLAIMPVFRGRLTFIGRVVSHSERASSGSGS